MLDRCANIKKGQVGKRCILILRWEFWGRSRGVGVLQQEQQNVAIVIHDDVVVVVIVIVGVAIVAASFQNRPGMMNPCENLPRFDPVPLTPISQVTVHRLTHGLNHEPIDSWTNRPMD